LSHGIAAITIRELDHKTLESALADCGPPRDDEVASHELKSSLSALPDVVAVRNIGLGFRDGRR
jgi:hypothetical protein